MNNTLNQSFETEVQKGERFTFGKNWQEFLTTLSDVQILEAEKSLKAMLEVENLQGKTFLDVGNGSGLFSLAARRLGAYVHSFDFDPSSVACAKELRRLYFADDTEWIIEQGSILDQNYLACLGQFEFVYAWGVLHHTGQMWRALELVASLVKPNGKLFVAIYNDQGRWSRYWRFIKLTYCRSPQGLKILLLFGAMICFWGPVALIDFLKFKPFASWRAYQRHRGMSPWHDVIDWIGGYPFEVAKPEELFDFYRLKGFELCRLKTVGGSLGNNQLVFKRLAEKV